MSEPFAPLPEPPCYAVIFTSTLRGDADGYGEMADRMVALASEQPGFLGLESTRGADGLGITVSYWRDEDAIRAWRANAEHRIAQQYGRERWYAGFALRIAKIERAYGFGDAIAVAV